MPDSTIRIKLISRGHSGHHWGNQLPASGSFTGECEFVFGLEDTRYDWLVVIDDVSRQLFSPPQTLHCADEHTLLVTTEPPTITHYGSAFCRQFAHVLTSQPPGSLKHPNRIYSHTGNLWYNGHNFAELDTPSLQEKTLPISTVCSSKQQHTIHNDRYQFCHWLTEQLPALNLFGHGSKFIEKKYDALDPYRFHLTIENYSGLHHWTEKLADSFLSGCYPIYYGCANLADYFPTESFVEIDLYNRPQALEQIRSLIEDPSFYPSRIDALLEAKRRVMHEHNLLHMIETLAVEKFKASNSVTQRKLYGRKQMHALRPSDVLDLAQWHIKRHFR